MPTIVANPIKRLLFDLENSTVTKAVWDEDNNLVEMTYSAVTGRVLKRRSQKPGTSSVSFADAHWGRRVAGHRFCSLRSRPDLPDP